MPEPLSPARRPGFPALLVGALAVLVVAVLVALVWVSTTLLGPLAELLVGWSGGDVSVQVVVSCASVAAYTVLALLVTHRVGVAGRSALGSRRVVARAVTGVGLGLVYLTVTWSGLPATRSTNRGPRRAEVVEAFVEAGGTSSAGVAYLWTCGAMALGALVVLGLALWNQWSRVAERRASPVAGTAAAVVGFWLLAGVVLALRF